MLGLTCISILALKNGLKSNATYGREQEAAKPEANGDRGPDTGRNQSANWRLAASLSPRIIPIIISAVKIFIRSTNLSPGIAGLGRSTQAANV